MTAIDKFQSWALEVIGTILLLVVSYFFVLEFFGTQTVSVGYYVLGWVVAFLMIGRKGLAKVLWRTK